MRQTREFRAQVKNEAEADKEGEVKVDDEVNEDCKYRRKTR